MEDKYLLALTILTSLYCIVRSKFHIAEGLACVCSLTERNNWTYAETVLIGNVGNNTFSPFVFNLVESTKFKK